MLIQDEVMAINPQDLDPKPNPVLPMIWAIYGVTSLSSLCLPDTVARIANQLFQWKLESSKTVDRQYRKGLLVVASLTKTKDTEGV